MAEVRRVVVLGGTGFFGRAVAGRLGALGLKSITASRRAGAGIRIDAESRASLKSTLRPFDVVVDAAGPFQSRGTALVEAAIETGFDVIDLSDSLGYAEKVADLRLRIEAAGIRVLTSCSSVSTLSALAIRLSGFEDPARLSVFLLPAARFTANRGTSRSLLRSVGAPIRVRRDGRLVERAGWSESRTFEMPRGGRARGFLCECSDGLLLPPVWPGLWRVDFYVRSGVPLAGACASAVAPARIAIAPNGQACLISLPPHDRPRLRVSVSPSPSAVPEAHRRGGGCRRRDGGE